MSFSAGRFLADVLKLLAAVVVAAILLVLLAAAVGIVAHYAYRAGLWGWEWAA